MMKNEVIEVLFDEKSVQYMQLSRVYGLLLPQNFTFCRSGILDPTEFLF